MPKLITRFIAFGARTGFLRPALEFARRVMVEYYTNESLHRIVAEKIAPLNARVDASEPRRVNILIPEIDFRTFYGGYIAKFNFARKLVEQGNRVRFITVDRFDTPRSDWPAIVEQYHGIEDIFDHVEVCTAYDRRPSIAFNEKDLLVATTWWTAHIANALLPQLRIGRFLYLIQEYEPFTFPMGSYYALAHESYSFPHVALFSSETLRDYFRRMHYGVFAHYDGIPNGVAFENAVLTFEPNLDGARRGPKKLLFYARPEAHAARNMFEIGFTALERAIREGRFDGEWEFYGIGTSHDDILLPRGKVLKMLGKVGLKEYCRLLPTFDLGLALMYTPHPSLLPIEMAAAGQVVVTNSCMNKTADVLNRISSNFVVADPTIDSVTTALGTAAERAGDLAARSAGARVAWSQDWDLTFNDALMRQILAWFPGLRLHPHISPGAPD